MNNHVGLTELKVPSSDGNSNLHVRVWIPLALAEASTQENAPSTAANELQTLKPRGVVQLIHGMAEHSGRYDDFARYLAQAGYLVAAHDHIAHGKTATCADERGVMDAAKGATYLIDDVQVVRSIMEDQVVPSTPYVIFGHSMGSLILRSYLPLFGEGLSGAVICGTAQETPAVAQAGNVLARSLAKKKGEGYRSKLLFNLADGAYNKSIKHPKTPFDWLARNEAVPQAYMADDLCGFMFGAGAYAALTELAFRAAARETLKKTPRHLPLFYIAGEEDPVGGCGKGVRAAAQAMMKAGSDDVSLKLYPGMRHEILNEVGNDLVYRDVLSWINDKTAQ